MADQTNPGDAQRYIIVRPDPDATPASMALVLREIGTIKEQSDLRAEAVKTRFDAMDRAVQLFEANLTRVPTAVQQEVGHLRELLIAMIKGEAEGNYRELVARLDDMDEAIKLVQGYRERLPSEVDDKLSHLKDWVVQRFQTVDEKFTGVEKGFALRDKAAETSSSEAKTNIKDALAAQEKVAQQAGQFATEAVTKTELQTIKLTDGLNGRITELGERETRLEGQVTALIREVAVAQQNQAQAVLTAQQNQQAAKNDQRADQTHQTQSSSYTVQLVAVGFGIAGFIMALVEVLSRAAPIAAP